MRRIRRLEKSNYVAIISDDMKTYRFRIDPLKEFKATLHPEHMDVAINSKCLANCPYCYVSALKSGSNFDNICDKALDLWGNMPNELKPFQIALGGAGEPTMHPDLIPFMKTVRELDIYPNYTTNGMHITDDLLDATLEYSGGVAVSYHPHIKKVFHAAFDKYIKVGMRTSVHFIIGEPGSFDKGMELYEQVKDDVDHFVWLPYQEAGRAVSVDVHNEWSKLFNSDVQENYAFGALFREWLLSNKADYPIQMYTPHLFSGYILMDDSYKTIRNSSYDLTTKQGEREFVELV